MMFTIIFRLTAAHELDLHDDRKIMTQQIYTNNYISSELRVEDTSDRCTCTCVCNLASICTPSMMPTLSPTTAFPTASSSTQTLPPTLPPTFFPSTSPSAQPTLTSSVPTISPTLDPTLQPTRLPSPFPTFVPTISRNNTGGPTRFPRGGSLRPLAVFGDTPTITPNLPYVVPGQLPYQYTANTTGYSLNINGSSL